MTQETKKPAENDQNESIESLSDFDHYTAEAIELTKAQSASLGELPTREGSRRPSRPQPTGPEQRRRNPIREAIASIEPKKAAAGIAATATIAAAMYGLTSGKGGNETDPSKNEVMENVSSISLLEGANLRFEPHVGDAEENNLVVQLTKPDDITLNGTLTVRPDTNNGNWYAISGDYIQDSLHDQLTQEQVDAIKADKDNLIWVNEQGVQEIHQNEETSNE